MSHPERGRQSHPALRGDQSFPPGSEVPYNLIRPMITADPPSFASNQQYPYFGFVEQNLPLLSLQNRSSGPSMTPLSAALPTHSLPTQILQHPHQFAQPRPSALANPFRNDQIWQMNTQLIDLQAPAQPPQPPPQPWQQQQMRQDFLAPVPSIYQPQSIDQRDQRPLLLQNAAETQLPPRIPQNPLSPEHETRRSRSGLRSLPEMIDKYKEIDEDDASDGEERERNRGRRGRRHFSTSSDADASTDDAKTLKRQKNTEAARRSRARKSARMKALETSVQEAEQKNRELSRRIAILESEKANWVKEQQVYENRISGLENQLLETHNNIVARFGVNALPASAAESGQTAIQQPQDEMEVEQKEKGDEADNDGGDVTPTDSPATVVEKSGSGMDK